MIEGFICPDGVKTTVEDCLRQCRMGERCLTLPTLVSISKEREWNGVASTTMLLNGTMHEFLRLTNPYYIEPDSRAFMLQGTKHHKELEDIAHELNLPAEIPLNIDRDIFDLLEFEQGQLVMTDYKLWGSFRVARALGIVETGKQPDPSGAVYKTNSKWGKAGSPKMVPKFDIVKEQADNFEAEMQQNRYRIMLKELGINLSRMQLQVTVRDGGLYIAHSRGVLKNVYRIPIPELPDDYVRDYFAAKDAALKQALKQGYWETPCSPQECWDGIRCKRFCDVAHLCPKGKIIKEINGTEKEE
jgi:hypothetical protein